MAFPFHGIKANMLLELDNTKAEEVVDLEEFLKPHVNEEENDRHVLSNFNPLQNFAFFI